MSDEPTSSVHWSFWAISAVTLIWNGLGVVNYLAQTNAAAVAAMPETHRAIIESRPAWATGGFAIAVFGGVVGCLLLLLRKSTAFYVFAVSLLGVVVTMVHTLGVAASADSFTTFENVIMILMPLLVSAYLVWYAKRAEDRGWIS